jgi:very-short-patch-repair endonuclease
VHPVDATIARFAAAQKELVTRRALLDAGVTGAAIDHRRATGDLTGVHFGVYTTARSPLTFEQRALAAVLACGGGAVLGDGWAAGLWRMLAEPPDPPQVRRSGHHRTGPAGVDVRRCAELDFVVHRGVPVTDPARTLLHLAAVGPIGRLEEALNEALYEKLVTRGQLDRLAARGRRGSAAIRELGRETQGYTRQGAERRLHSLILKAQLPRPTFNATIEGHAADVLWTEHKLVVEVDGYASHARRRAFEHDRRLDQQRTAAGYRTIRITWRQLVEEPEAIVARLAATLARS